MKKRAVKNVVRHDGICREGAVVTTKVVYRQRRWWCGYCDRSLAECAARAVRGHCRETP